MKTTKGYFLSGLLLLFIIWIVSSMFVQNDLVIPSFQAVVKAFQKMVLAKTTWMSLGNTLFNLVLAILICFIIALILSLLVINIKPLEVFLSPLFAVLRTVPIIAVIVVLLIVFGNQKSPSLITGFVLLPILYEQYLTTFKTTQPALIDDLSLLGASKWQTLMYVYFPLSKPVITSSLIQALGLGLKAMVMAEFIAQPKNTVGYQIMQSVTTLDTASVFAWTIILIIFVLFGEGTIKKIRIEK
ncbi:MAG: ABC transporter permease [Bacilli bacterium]